MGNKKRPLTAAERAACAEFRAGLGRVKSRHGRTQEQVAELVGVTQGQIWQWANARLAIPAVRAPAVADAIEEPDPGQISVAYRELAAGDQRKPALIVNQLENDIDAIRYALGALYSVLSRNRPDEGAELIAELDKAEPRFRSKEGLLHLLRQVAEQHVRRATARPPAGRAAGPARPGRKRP